MTGARAPRVSVLVPAFNEPAETLEESLASLRRQTFADFECLVVDDSTKPELAAACEAACARDPRFRYIHPPTRQGLAAGLNLALEEAGGEFIARFDSDDVCHPDRLRRQVEAMDVDPALDVLGSALRIMDSAGAETAVRHYALTHDEIARRMQTSNAMAHPTVMIRRRVLDRYGAYRPEFRFAEDLELWLRLLNAGARFGNLAEPLVNYRQDATHRSADNWRYNLRARRTNFSAALWPRRVAGIAIIAAWSVTPAWLRARIYDLVIFRRGASAIRA
jgi:glycosyltransferase involved in cell wall biosynthesis